ncbi:MAG: heparan-alpha-glucosaminide N-acetyltransferase domain-containing protein [Gammaproteobacteria bacterium]
MPALARWRGDHPLVRTLAFGGRHSLFIYMVHQPLFFAMLALIFMR